jgi:hypothetical protein
MTAAGDLAERRAELAIVDLRAVRMDRVPHSPLFERCWLRRANSRPMTTSTSPSPRSPGSCC